MEALCADLAAEHESLDALVADLPVEAWDRPTPAAGWTVRDQISHLAYFDASAVLALLDAEAFARSVDALLAAASGGSDPSVELGRALTPADLLERWRAGRAELLTLARQTDPKQRVAWYGPPMSARSFVTARLMETWAHGQDVADGLGVERPPTSRLRHVAHLGVTARPWSYVVRGLDPPDTPVLVELRGPDGDVWTWGEAGVPDRVGGPALDFCLVVTQRRHVADTALVVEGPAATEWMTLAQAFAGPPGPGREPGQFASTGPS